MLLLLLLSVLDNPKQRSELKMTPWKLTVKINSSLSLGVCSCTPSWNSQNVYKESQC